MIYNYSKNLESYKERNLYYKVFAGYLFNELLPDYQKKKAAFSSLLKKQIGGKQHFGKSEIDDTPLSSIIEQLSLSEVQVSFDYHLIQIDKGYKDRGEVSDIIIWGKDNFVSIEVKYLSDWTYEKDIEQVQKRIVDLEKKTEKHGVQVLLIKEEKWKNNSKKLNQSGSNLNKLKENKLGVPLIVLTWEGLVDIIENQKVKEYVLEQLERKINQTNNN